MLLHGVAEAFEIRGKMLLHLPENEGILKISILATDFKTSGRRAFAESLKL